MDNYNCKRPGVPSWKRLTIEQRKQMMFEYMNVIMGRELNPGVIHTSSVQALAHKWGMERCYFSRQRKKALSTPKMSLEGEVRIWEGIRVMDRPEYESELVKLMIERTDGLSNRQLLRAFNKRLGARITLITMQRKLKAMNAQKHKPVMEPAHKNEHVVRRLIYATGQLSKRWLYHFDIDEKLFYCQTGNGYVWTLPDHMTEDEMNAIKTKKVWSKRYITKVMIMTAVGRPMHTNTVDFDGKLFIGRCSVPYTAKQDGATRKAGETFDHDCMVNGELYVAMVNQMLARISVVFSAEPGAIITIQHDGAGPHRSLYAENEVQRLGARNIPMVLFTRQDPQSPEENVNDLAIYRHMGSVVAEFDYRTAEELCVAIMDAWRRIPEDMLERVFALKCIVFKEIVRAGGKSIKIPRLGLAEAQRHGMLWRYVEEFMAQ